METHELATGEKVQIPALLLAEGADAVAQYCALPKDERPAFLAARQAAAAERAERIRALPPEHQLAASFTADGILPAAQED